MAFPAAAIEPGASSSGNGPFPSGFFFRPRNQKMNWHKISQIDPESIARQRKLEELQYHVDMVTFSDINEVSQQQRALVGITLAHHK